MNTDLVRLTTWAETNHVDVRRVRRAARAGNLAGARYLDNLGIWVIDKSAPVPVGLTVPSTGRGRKRSDGRKRFIVYMTNAEHDQMLITHIVPSDCIVDGAERARNRKIAKTT